MCFRVSILFDLRVGIFKELDQSQVDVHHVLGGEVQRATKCIEHLALGVGNSAIVATLVIATFLHDPTTTLLFVLVFLSFIFAGKKLRALLIEGSVTLSNKVHSLGKGLADKVPMDVEACLKINREIFNTNVQLNESDARSERLLEFNVIGLLSLSCLYFSTVMDVRTILLVLLFGFIGKIGLDFLRGIGSCFRKVNNAYGGLDSIGRIISEGRYHRLSNKQ